MPSTAKLFKSGRSQAVRLPKEFRFEGSEVNIRRDPATGEVILSPRRHSWAEVFATLDAANVPADFLSEAERDHSSARPDPFEGMDFPNGSDQP